MDKKLWQAIGMALMLSGAVIWYLLNVIEFKLIPVIIMIIIAFGAVGMWRYVIELFQNRN